MTNPENTTGKLKTINLQGKAYVQVKDRLKYFRENFKDYGILTEAKSNEGSVMFIADIVNAENRTVARAHSFGKISGQKAFEKLETVAVGRALALFGIGIDDSVASADEIQDFQASQS